MQSLDLDERFALIFIADGTFGLLSEDADIVATLSRVKQHLDPGGCFAFDFDPPQPIDDQGHWSGGWVQAANGTIIAKRVCRRFDEQTGILAGLRIDEKWINGRPGGLRSMD